MVCEMGLKHGEMKTLWMFMCFTYVAQNGYGAV